jgi:chromosome transmission fidelity protein 4
MRILSNLPLEILLPCYVVIKHHHLNLKLAVATDRRNLRIFSYGGIQREILSLPGPVVALAGCGKQIFIAVHMGMALPGNQAIGIAILTVGERRHRNSSFTLLPLAPKSMLSWIGFTDQGTVSNTLF